MNQKTVARQIDQILSAVRESDDPVNKTFVKIMEEKRRRS